MSFEEGDVEAKEWLSSAKGNWFSTRLVKLMVRIIQECCTVQPW